MRRARAYHLVRKNWKEYLNKNWTYHHHLHRSRRPNYKTSLSVHQSNWLKKLVHKLPIQLSQDMLETLFDDWDNVDLFTTANESIITATHKEEMHPNCGMEERPQTLSPISFSPDSYQESTVMMIGQNINAKLQNLSNSTVRQLECCGSFHYRKWIGDHRTKLKRASYLKAFLCRYEDTGNCCRGVLLEGFCSLALRFCHIIITVLSRYESGDNIKLMGASVCRCSSIPQLGAFLLYEWQ